MASVFNSGNTDVITGGASGIGLALAKKCQSYGMKILITDINEETLSSASASVQGAIAVKADLSNLDDWTKVKHRVQSDLGGKIHLLALNAGRSVKSGWDD